MKIKYLAAACMALGASASFAATLACDTTTPVTFVNTCAPEATLFVAGSSALGGVLGVVLPADLFDVAAMPLVTVKNVAVGDAQASSTSAWYGMSKATATGGVSKRLFVVYNKNNGSAAGPSVMLTKAGTFPESTVVNVGPNKTTPNTCVAGSTSTTVNCTSVLARQADIAITDVHPLELYAVYAGVKLGTLAKPTFIATPVAMQGFGVAVNENLYEKLQSVQLPSCTAGAYTLDCQPSISSAKYSALVTKDGSVKTAAALVGDPADTTVLTLARRDDLSGTQATSNIFFARNGCGGIGVNAVVDAVTGATTYHWNQLDGATKDSKIDAAVLGGGMDILASANSTAALVVGNYAVTGDVKQALSATSGYAIGVLGLADPSSTTTPPEAYKFVKLDGVSPNFKLDGTTDAKYRDAMINGRYPLQVMSYASVLPKPAGSLKAFPALADKVIAGLKDSSLHNLTAMGYVDGAVAAQQSKVVRFGGNNCAPLVWK